MVNEPSVFEPLKFYCIMVIKWNIKFVECAPCGMQGSERSCSIFSKDTPQMTTNILTELLSRVCVCVYSNSRNDVPRVAPRRHASVLIVFVVFCVHSTVLPV